MTLIVGCETPDQLDILSFLAQADARSASLHLAKSRHGLPIATVLNNRALVEKLELLRGFAVMR